MKKTILFFAFLFISTFAANGQTKFTVDRQTECDCEKERPWTPQVCYEKCMKERFLGNGKVGFGTAKQGELVFVVGLSENTAAKVAAVNAEKKGIITSLEDYKKAINNDEEYKDFLEKIKSLNDEDFQYFQNTRKQREDILFDKLNTFRTLVSKEKRSSSTNRDMII